VAPAPGTGLLRR